MSSEDRDGVDAIAAQWAAERPDLDVRPMEVIGRLQRVSDIFDRRLRTVFATAGLGNGDFDVLATLRRSGPPYTLTPGELTATMMITSGAITKRIDRLERAGLVERRVADNDARGRRITLTEAGKKIQADLHPQHLANEEDLLSAWSQSERDQVARLLKKLLLSLEPSTSQQAHSAEA